MTTANSIEHLVERADQAFNAHDVAGWGALYAPDCIVTDPQYPEPLRGREAVERDIRDFFDTFGDIQVRTTGVAVQGRTCVWEGAARGTHTGPLQLPGQEIPATNRSMELSGCHVVVLNDEGLIAEERRYYDLAGVLVQLGLLD